MLGFLFLLVVASILGSIGAAIAGRKQMGCLGSIATGFIGALLGRWLEQQLDLEDPLVLTIRDTRMPLIFTIAGAALFVALINLISGRSISKG